MPSEKPTFLRIPKRAGVQTDHGGDQDGPPTPTTQRPTDEEPVGSGSDTIAGGGKDTTTGGGGENPSTGGDGKDTTTGGGSDASGGGSGDDTTNGGGSGPAKTITRTWQSGDFQETPRDNPPYNGITITASYQPNSDGGFDGAKIVFTDYTLVKKGASTTIPDLRVSKDWTPVPQPKAPSKTANDSTSPAKQVETGEQGKAADAPSDDETFTIKGDVRIQSETNGSFLRVRLQYGAARVREEIGFVFRLDASEQTPKKLAEDKMLSDVTYENRSRNENVERVGLFWDFSEEAGAIPLIWAVIYRCRYRWTHPIQIGRALACHLIEDDGATTKLEDLEGPLRVPGVLMSTRFRAWGEVVEVTLTEGHPYRRAALLRNGLPMVERVLPPAGRIDLPIPTALTFTADVTSKAGQPVQRYDLSPGARAFDIRRADPLQVIMFGGEPGPDCRALAFSETADAR